jgi:PAS domain S-box-containing protein
MMTEIPEQLPDDSVPALQLAERCAAVIEALPDAILLIDRNWYITYANPEAIRISRLLPELFPTAPFFELFPDIVGTELETRYRAAMASGRRDQFEYRYPRFDVWVDINLLPTDDGFAVFYRDITAAKKTEAREAAITRQVRQVFEAIPDGVVIVDQDWRFSFANQRALELVGNPDILGHNIFELFPGNGEEPFGSSYRTTMAQRIPTAFEAFHTAPINLWLKVQAKPFTLNDRDEGIIVFFSDISERKQAELREKETARRLAQTLEVTSDAVITLDRQWRFTFLNNNAHALIDPERRVLGRNIWEEFPQAVGNAAWEIYHRSMDLGLSGTAEVYSPAPVDAWLHLQSEPTADGIVVFFRDITEDKRQADLIRAQQELLASVQEVARLATWEMDIPAAVIAWGPGSFPVLGHPLDRVFTFPEFESILLPGHAQRLDEELNRAVRTGESVMMEFAVRAVDGSVLWIESRGQLVAGTDPAPRVRGMSIDITSRKLYEQNLVASEERYRVLADLNPQAIWMGDPRGNITYANQGFLAYIGLTLETIGGLGWLQAFAPEDSQRVVEVWTRSVATGLDYDIKARLRHAATGEYRWWHLRAAPIRDSSGGVLNWLGVGSDIHDATTYAETLRAEQAETERRRAELETIYRTTPIGLALLDPVEFRFLNLNDQEADMLGYPKEYLLGRTLSEIAPPERLPGLMEMMQSVAAGTVIKDRLLEGELAARPGEPRAWRVNYSPIFNEDGSVRAISTASIEITNQKKAEAALIQSEKLAAVGRLASSISHEINNPLEAITNLLYLIAMEDDLPATLKGYVHMAQSELSRVSQIATQTLRFHRQAVAPTAVSAQELVGAVVRLYTGRLANSNIAVDARYSTNTRIVCFENDIRQVLNNLIANAIDAMRTGGRLSIRAHACHDHAGEQRGGRDLAGQPSAGVDGPRADAAWTRNRPGVRITIADTGHGMSPAVVARVFEPFFTTKDLNGTGLGLWISSGIVERHQGRLRVRSTDHPVRHGTVFTLFLPCKEAKPVSG